MASENLRKPPSHGSWSLIDAYTPEEIADKIETVGLYKAHADPITTVVLALIAGAYVTFGAGFSTVAMASTGLGYSLTRLLGGLAFSLALVLIIVGGAELFTSNALLVMGWASRRITVWRLLRNWGLVLVGNLVGVTLTAVLFAVTGYTAFGDHAVGVQVLETATTKLERSATAAVAVGILGNALICLAVWLSFSARTTADRILAISGPTTAMVAFEFDHVVANAYYHVAALMIRATEPDVVAAAEMPPDVLAAVTVPAVAANLGLVALGNMVGGGGLVASVYWFVYARQR